MVAETLSSARRDVVSPPQLLDRRCEVIPELPVDSRQVGRRRRAARDRLDHGRRVEQASLRLRARRDPQTEVELEQHEHHHGEAVLRTMAGGEARHEDLVRRSRAVAAEHVREIVRHDDVARGAALPGKWVVVALEVVDIATTERARRIRAKRRELPRELLVAIPAEDRRADHGDHGAEKAALRDPRPDVLERPEPGDHPASQPPLLPGHEVRGIGDRGLVHPEARRDRFDARELCVRGGAIDQQPDHERANQLLAQPWIDEVRRERVIADRLEVGELVVGTEMVLDGRDQSRPASGEPPCRSEGADEGAQPGFDFDRVVHEATLRPATLDDRSSLVQSRVGCPNRVQSRYRPSAVDFAGFKLDLASEQLHKAGRPVTLRRKPFAILRYLATNPHRLITHAELLERVWQGTTVSESAVRTHVHELRQVLGEGVIETVIGRGYRFAAEISEGSAPRRAVNERMVVGRDRELDVLRKCLADARRGERQICFVTGDPGMGKTTLVDAFLDDCDNDVLVLRGASIEQHGTPEAYAPVIEMLSGMRGSPHLGSALAALKKFAPTFVLELSHLFPDVGLDTRRRGGEAKPLGELVDAFEALANQRTLVVVHEDVHWSDVATLDVLGTLATRRGPAKLCMIATARSSEAATVSNPVNRVMRSLASRSIATTLALDRIEEREVADYVALRFPNHDLPAELTRAVATITNGTPLFVVSLIDDLVRREMIRITDGVARLAITIPELAAHRPESVRQLVDMQVDRLERDEQRVLETASVIGQEFSTALVAAALELSIEDVDDVCDGLARRQQFLRREEVEEWPTGEVHTRYAFRHALVEEVCIERTAIARRQGWHRRIAERLEAAHQAEPRPIAHVLARHFDLGQSPARAVRYYLLAAEHNERRFASADALRQSQRARELLARIPNGLERDGLELDILGHLAQGGFRVITPMAQPLEMYERMVTLSRATNDPQRLGRALANLSYRYSTLAQYHRALAVVDEIDALHRASPLPPDVIGFGGLSRAVALVWNGQLAAGKALLTELIATPIPFDPSSPGILGPTNRAGLLHSFLAHVKFAGEDSDEGLAGALHVLDLATASGDNFFLGAARTHVSRYRMLRDDSPAEVKEIAASVLAMPDAAAPWFGPASLMVAWADARLGTLATGQLDAVVAGFHARIAAFPQGGTTVGMCVILALRAAGRTSEALEFTTSLIAFARRHDELIHEPDLLRHRGELAGSASEAEADYLEAIASGTRSGALGSVLRAATRLAALRHGTATHDDGYDQLAAALARMSPASTAIEVRKARARLALR